jgi:hypothetical protein
LLATAAFRSRFRVSRGQSVHSRRIEANCPTPAGSVRVDLSGEKVIPALVDGYSHIG